MFLGLTRSYSFPKILKTYVIDNLSCEIRTNRTSMDTELLRTFSGVTRLGSFAAQAREIGVDASALLRGEIRSTLDGSRIDQFVFGLLKTDWQAQVGR